MRISKAMREEAIEDSLIRSDYWSARLQFGSEELMTVDLATSAFDAVPHMVDIYDLHDRFVTMWLEAAALLRDGWSPGDPVEKLVA